VQVIRAHFPHIEGTSSEALSVSSIMLLHYVIPMVTTKSVTATGKDAPAIIDFSKKVARIIMKLASHTSFSNESMMNYNNLVRHLTLPFERFCADMTYEGRDFESDIADVPNPVTKTAFYFLFLFLFLADVESLIDALMTGGLLPFEGKC
jgi:hypothetical protein